MLKKNLLLMIFVLFSLSSCTGDTCLDPDDFGFSSFTISSRYTKDELNQQQQGTQVAPWVDSNLAVNGKPLTIVVRTWQYGVDGNNSGELSAWCPWFGAQGDERKLSRFCQRLRECSFSRGMCPNGGAASNPTNIPVGASNGIIDNAPCILKNGKGLYALVASLNTDPNASFVTQRNPDGLTFHLGEPVTGYSLYDFSKSGPPRPAGGVIYKYNDDPALQMQYASSKLYFKILDRFYDDNNGQYRIVVKSGVESTQPDPIKFLTDLVRNNLFGVNNDYGLIRNIYTNITNNSGYRIAVSAMLSLYIIFTAFSFLIGNLNITHTELIIRVIKVGIISALLSSEYSWSFFNDYLFAYFIKGVDQIIAMVQAAGSSGPGSSSIIALMIAPQTMAKLIALLFVDPFGWAYIILFLIALAFFFKLIFEGTIIYLTALIAIGMIIVMAPIFLCFLLFQITRSLFENWLRQLIAYALQPIILFTGIVFMSMIIRSEIYSTLGFRVCKYSFPDFGPISSIIGNNTEGADPSLTNSLFYWWFPSPMKGENFSKAQAVIPVPMDHYAADGSLCLAYGCQENRYVELPFLDPNTDSQRINNFFQGNFVQLDGIWLIFIALYLLSKFYEFSISSARFISSTSGNLTDLKSAGMRAYAPIATQIARPFNKISEQLSRRVDKVTGGISDGASALYERAMLNSVRKDALSSEAEASVLQEVKNKYGIDRKDININAQKEYMDALRAKLREAEPDLKGRAFEMKLSKLAQADYKDLAKEYQNGTLKKLSSDMQLARDFENAYVRAHQDMSARGIGFFGKKFRGIRALQEIDNAVAEDENRKRQNQLDKGRKIYSAYEGVKRKLIEGVVGEKLMEAIESDATGAQWHDFDYDDPALRTYAEQMKDEEKRKEYRDLTQQVNRETLRNNKDVLKPEFFAELVQDGKAQELEHYQQMARTQLSIEVYQALSASEDPALMGEKFMKEKATDSQLRHMEARAREIEKELIENDRYIKRADYYEGLQEIATENTQRTREFLSKQFRRDDIKDQEIPSLLREYYKNDPEEAEKYVSLYQKSIEEQEFNKQVLSKIEERREWIKAEVDKHIKDINEHRKSL